jgi:hypothetical protein
MSAFAKIDSALVAGYVAGSFGLSTAYDNVDFTPTVGTAWARVTTLPVQPAPSSIGTNGEDAHAGVFQITLNYPPNTGRADILAKADAIAAVFYPGASFTYSGQSVTVSSCGITQARIIENWCVVYVSVNWFARVPR